MMEAANLKLLGGFHIASVGLLALWWLALGLFLPVAEADAHFEVLILHPNWVPVNVVGLVACVILVLTAPVLVFHNKEDGSALGFVGLVVAEIGLVLFTCVQYYETFLWPVAARTNPELVSANGPLVFGDPLVLVPLVLSGVCLGLGYILLGTALFIRRSVPRAAAVVLMAGALLFGNGVLFPVRTVGLILFVVATTICVVAILRARRWNEA